MTRAVEEADVAKTRGFQPIQILRRSRHRSGSVAIRKVLESFFISTIRAHDVREHERRARLDYFPDVGQQIRLRRRVAEDLATNNMRDLTKVGRGKVRPIVEIAAPDGDELADT